MNARSSLPLLLLILVLGGAGLYFLAEDTGVPNDDLAVIGEPGETLAKERPDSNLTTPAAPPETRADAPVAVPEETEEAPIPRAAMSKAIWVEGRVQYPPDTPVDEKLYVVAKGKRFKGKETKPTEYRGEVQPNGKFRVAFAKGTRRGKLTVDGKYLYMESAFKILTKSIPESIVLEPKLGGCIEVTLVPPGGVFLEDDLEGADIETYLESSESFFAQRSGKSISEGRYLVNALQPAPDYRLNVDTNRFLDTFEGGVGVKPGEVTKKEIELERGVRLAGIVVDPEGNPLAQANVTITSDSSWDHVMTDEEGRFDQGGLGAGDLSLEAKANGFLATEQGPFDLQLGASKLDLELKLSRGASIAGRVLWPDGSPVVEAIVKLEQDDRGGGYFLGDDDSMTKTDSDGAFSYTGLESGDCTITVKGKPVLEAEEGESEMRLKRRQKKAPFWHAKIENVPPGTANLSLVLRPGSEVRGTVVDDQGKPLDRFRVTARVGSNKWFGGGEGAVSTSVRKSEDGTFELEGLKEGSYTVTATSKGYADSSEAKVDIPWNGELVEIVLPREASVSGVVVDLQGKPLEGALVRTSQNDFMRSNKKNRTDEKGVFELKNVSPGEVRLRAEAPDFAGSEWMEFTIAPAEVREGIVLEVRSPSKLTGELHRSQEKLAKVEINLNPLGGGGWEETRTDEEGRFEFEGLDPGEYEVSFTPEMDDVSREDDDWWAMQQARRQTERITLGEGDTGHVVLGSPPDNPIQVTGLVTAGGQPVANKTITINQRKIEGDNRASTRTDETGAFSVVLDGPGTYRFNFGRDWGKSLYFDREVPNQEAVRLEFELPTASLSGVITSSDGTPYADSRVYLSLDDNAEDDGADVSGNRIAETDENGAFEFKDLPDGTYTLRAGGVEYWEYDRVGEADARLLHTGIEIKAEKEIAPLEIRLRRGGRMKGTVTDASGTPVPDARVQVLDSEDRPLQVWQMTSTDAAGQFDVRALPAERLTFEAFQGDRVGRASARVVAEGTAEVQIILE